MTVHWRNRYSH